ncbi:hypothetical protein M011DRAFT_452578 [Sporormia fimetaria CBS 119925]|uniref:Pre-rRNA-processing protein-like protein TSR2 n=1 Tax=Sporormia fimetaria CBS 119925 TaxID=1340428 RepID=A0A6A6UYF5_9PLEO|nr:hypothetical protein M011DRAFT_452578 [Sporormia fimetaria CBS 119925]
MSTNGVSTASAEEIQRNFDLGIWYTLFNWADLTVAVQNQWGGPDSADKRDWLAGAISEAFEAQSDIDQEDIEVILLQALEDEFGVRLEDESEVVVARDIMRLRQETQRGEFDSVQALQKKWEARKGKEVDTGNLRVEAREPDDDMDSVDEETDEDEDGDVEMEDAPALVASKPKEKAAPEIDEDGFEKVTRKGRR